LVKAVMDRQLDDTLNEIEIDWWPDALRQAGSSLRLGGQWLLTQGMWLVGHGLSPHRSATSAGRSGPAT
jgi:hypothetical protein